MNTTHQKAFPCAFLFALLFLIAPASRAGVVYIDQLKTMQTNTTYNSSATNTVAAAGAVGGFRTLVLTSINNDLNDESSRLRVLTNAPTGARLVLASGSDATADFDLIWGGAGGTAGLGGIDFRDGITPTEFSLNKSTVNFNLLGSDSPNDITWTFTDTSANTATYTVNLQTNAPYPNPAIPYAISLASFTGANTINWSSINFITLSGGGVASLDMTLSSPLSVSATTIPEPGTWAAAGLLLLTAAYVRRRRSQGVTTEEAPVAA
jgi:hypothetical protein